MEIEICRYCPKVVITDCTSSGLYCSEYRDNDQEWKEHIQYKPATPEGCHFVAQKYCCAENKKTPKTCPFYLEQVIAEDERLNGKP